MEQRYLVLTQISLHHRLKDNKFIYIFKDKKVNDTWEQVILLQKPSIIEDVWSSGAVKKITKIKVRDTGAREKKKQKPIAKIIRKAAASKPARRRVKPETVLESKIIAAANKKIISAPKAALAKKKPVAAKIAVKKAPRKAPVKKTITKKSAAPIKVKKTIKLSRK